MNKHLFVNAVAAITVGAGTAVPLSAQGGQIWIEPHVGWLVPTKDLGRTDVLANSGFGIFEQVDPSAIIGLGVGVQLTSRLGLRASFDRTLNASVQGEWRCAPFVACPAVLLPLEGAMSRWTATVDGLYHPLRGLPFDPFVSLGLGLRRSALEWNEPAADIELPAFAFDEVAAFYRLGLGIERAFGPATLFSEVTMMTSRFGGGPYQSIEGGIEADRRSSLDVGLMGGVRLRLR